MHKITKAVAVLVATGLVFFAAYIYRKYRIAPAIDIARIEVVDALGQPTRILRSDRRPLIVVFYASWCHDCSREMPKLQQALVNKPGMFDVAAITDEGMQSLMSYRNRYRYPFTFYTLTQPFDTCGIEAIPTVYKLDAKGEITYSKVGEVDWNQITRAE